ncbi:MAG: Tol-Pal system beta propeller repeat protein TolB [Deltaproteobacteria bacterium]|nr:Tol-Pal system beta propeller repeat protein TolB [Deltaproteobacteria bacterium]
MKKTVWLFGFWFLMFATPVWASIYIVVDQPQEKKFPIAVPDFVSIERGGETKNWSEKLPELLRHDLEIAGFFDLMSEDSFPSEDHKNFAPEKINFAAWNLIGTQALVKGAYSVKKDLVTVEMRLFDPALGKQLVGHRYTSKPDEMSVIAHHFVDEIILALTGERGPFSTQIAYVGFSGKHKELFTTDIDGGNNRPLTSLKSITLSPSWDPTGTRLVFSSYVNGSPELHTISGRGGKPQRLTNSHSIIITPIWMRDGSGIIASTSVGDEDEDLWLFNLQGGRVRKLTDSYGIDLNPSWSPDGSQFVFASEREGHLHIFRADANGQNVQRLTFVGHHNDNPEWSPKGDKIVFQGRDEGVFDIFVMNTDGSMIQRLTAGSGNNENPSWAPNGRYIAFSSTRSGKNQIMVMMSDGANQMSILQKGGGIHPSWSPWLAK